MPKADLPQARLDHYGFAPFASGADEEDARVASWGKSTHIREFQV